MNSPTVSSFAISREGARERNEDALLACTHPHVDAHVFAVCDGLGAQRDGARAAQTAIDATQAAFFAMKAVGDPRGTVLALLQAARAAVLGLSKGLADERSGRPDSTIVIVLLAAGPATCAHLGDSRAYRVGRDGMQPLTTDHSLAAAMESSLPPREDPDRTKLLRTISSVPRIEDVGAPIALSEKETFLLCSDGLWQSVADSEMHRQLLMASSPQNWIERLERSVEAVADPNQDNFTALVITVDGKETA